MRLLFATTVAHLPEGIGGMQTSTHALARRLQDAGVEVAAFAAARRPDQLVEDAAAVPTLNLDQIMGYPTFRASRPLHSFGAVLESWPADIVVLPYGTGTAPLAALALARGLKLILYVHSVEPRDLAAFIVEQPGLAYVANSRFTARRLQALLGIEAAILPPVIEPGDYRVAAPGDAVAMINPTIHKGAEIFFRLAAARPRIPFLAVESWGLARTWRGILANRAAALGNVELWQPGEDMREVYRRARVLLMPSGHEETFGRSLAEAQVSGIPALVSDRGALPETVGAGGLVVPLHASPGAWAAALDRLWNDPAEYARRSAAAGIQAARPELDPALIAAGFLRLAETLIAA